MLSCALVGLGIVFLVVPLALAAPTLRNQFHRGQDLHHTHKKPIPRLGGLVLAMAFIGIEAFIAICWPERRSQAPGRAVVLLSSLAMFGLGFWDDLKPLGAKRKLLAQIMIALSVCVFGIGIEQLQIPFSSITLDLGDWGVLVTILWLVGMTNLINLIDGMDGLAGGICLMLMGLLAYVGHDSGGFELLVVRHGGRLDWVSVVQLPARAHLPGRQRGLFSGLPDRACSPSSTRTRAR